MSFSEITYREYLPTAEEFNELTDSVGWGKRDKRIVTEALANSLFIVGAFDEERLIGLGRIIGDKTIFVHIHDVVVRPEYQGKKIGTGIMNALLEKIKEYKWLNPNLRAYLGASKGREAFYEKFGFVKRPNEELGCGMILK